MKNLTEKELEVDFKMMDCTLERFSPRKISEKVDKLPKTPLFE